ncbi:uncharacterized protein LOC144487239, partial [Mustelus asterias]
APDTAPIHPGNESSDESSEDMGEGTSEGGTVYPSASTSQTTIAETDTSRLPDQLSICSLFLFGLHQYSDELCDCPFSPGSSTIPETVVPVRRCSTHATGWLRGSHPSLREGIVKRTVCFHWSGNTCRWHQEIKIKRCSNFFVYELKKPPVCSLAYCTVSKSFDPCVKHRVLNQPWRSTNCVGNLCSDSVQCDQSLVLGWYRFKSPGSSTIPETVVPARRCSTHATGWLRGSHPSLREGIVKRTVCFHWSGNTCRWHQEIKIKRCSNFFVYELKKPRVCSLAYCTVSKSFDPCVKHRVLNQPWRSTNCVGNLCSDSVQCDQSLVLGWYRFKSPGSSTIPETVVPARRCSTHATGWLRGSHPSLREGIVKRTVCFHWSGNTCRWHQEIKIKRCSNFFVYELKKPRVCSLAYCTVSKSFDPCVKHRVLNQPWRSTNCVGNLCSDSVQCDQSLVLGWYRFKSPGSSTIPETVVPVRRCSTHATGWLKGSHPSLREGIVKRTVCFHWSGNTCRWHQEIKIKRCYNFFVYELKKSPACSLAYCTEAGPVPTQPPTPQTSPPYDSPHWNVTAASGIGGTQIKLVIKFMGHVGVEVMQNIILELQLSLKNRFPDVDLHLSIADD